MILRDRANNVNPVLQDTVEAFLDNFSQFLTRVLDLTYNYQIFLTSSIPPSGGEDRFFPWGVREPMAWMIGVLEKFHLQESLVKFKIEEKTVEDQIRVVKEDMSQSRRFREEIEKLEAEIKKVRLSNPIWMATNEKRIKWWEDQKLKNEQDLRALVQRYTKDPSELDNRVASVQAIEREVNRKEEILSALRETRTVYESRLRADPK